MRMREYTPKEFIHILKENGWQLCRNNSNHITFRHPEFTNIVTVPCHQKTVSLPLAKRLLKEAKILH